LEKKKASASHELPVIVTLTLSHSVTDDLTTAEHDFFAVMRVVMFNLDPEFSITKTDTITGIGDG